MKLLDSLYFAQRVDDNEYRITLHPDHIIYQAHFPGRPITPGVCLVQMVQEVLEQQLGRSLRLTLARNVKFISTIEPLVTPEFTLRFTKISEEEGGALNVQVQFVDEQAVRVKMSMRYE